MQRGRAFCFQPLINPTSNTNEGNYENIYRTPAGTFLVLPLCIKLKVGRGGFYAIHATSFKFSLGY